MTRRIDVRILTPFGAASGMGNWRTASRYAQMLRSSGVSAEVFEPSGIEDACIQTGQRCVAIVLNAQRSADEVAAFHRAGIPVLLVMTGTDLYVSLKPEQKGTPAYGRAEQSLTLASMIVTLQDEARRELLARWPELDGKVHVLLQTSPIRKPFAPVITHQSKTVRFMIAGHIREEKDPRTGFLAFHKAFPDGWARRADGGRVPVRLIHVGSYQDKTLMQELMLMSGRYPGILLEGPLSHAETMRSMTHVHCLIQPSVSEGGALVISEAVACRLPVIASNIPAHRAQLGEDYPGLFAVGDADQLAQQLTRFVADTSFSEVLRSCQPELALRLTATASERDELLRMVRKLAESPSKEFA
jgi:glycosyltransferase involved in cell wall biosynthesis